MYGINLYRSVLASLLVLLLAAPTSGCGSDDPGSESNAMMTPSEPSRAEYVAKMSTTLCDRWQSCEKIGEGKEYATYEECIAERQTDFFDLWPEGQCNRGQINAGAFDECDTRASVYDCNAGALDFLGFVDQCNASRVCTDEPDDGAM